MTEEDQVASLKARHAELEEALERENNRPMPDQAALAELKKRKLQIKDELARLGAAAH